ncbi:hypothetical protein ACFQZ4_15715 [Catellatospora coxensis]|uniref:Uncharacterized protein n=1 Tax=Catellatospora coxensis TaxID=310354 RepID=A0A8J3P4G0_9ACTN|nr:hypothetical protein [Catellatospora coxensis]GIG03332.1 hypothetical protein Cco03nite_00320 [Catellatospora coxensis]
MIRRWQTSGYLAVLLAILGATALGLASARVNTVVREGERVPARVVDTIGLPGRYGADGSSYFVEVEACAEARCEQFWLTLAWPSSALRKGDEVRISIIRTHARVAAGDAYTSDIVLALAPYLLWLGAGVLFARWGRGFRARRAESRRPVVRQSDRAVVCQIEPWAIIYGGPFVIGLAVAGYLGWPLTTDNVLMLVAVFGPVLALIGVFGVARRVVVLPERVKVLGAVTELSIPRSRIMSTEVSAFSHTAYVVLRECEGGGTVKRELPGLFRKNNTELDELLAAVVEAPNACRPVTRRPRWSTIILLVLPLVAIIGVAR